MQPQFVDLRHGNGPAYESIGNQQQRLDYLERRAAAQQAMTSRYAVNLECSLPLSDGQVLSSLQPVDLSLFHAAEARALLARGVVMESLTWPSEPRQPWE